jgi:hypothetical protein
MLLTRFGARLGVKTAKKQAKRVTVGEVQTTGTHGA